MVDFPWMGETPDILYGIDVPLELIHHFQGIYTSIGHDSLSNIHQ